MSFQFLVGVTLGPHESWPPPWENPGYAAEHILELVRTLSVVSVVGFTNMKPWSITPC